MRKWPFSRKTRILVVDDEGGFTRLLKLAASQYEIRAENDPFRAVGAAEDFVPDLIFLDRYMPGMSGDQLAVSLQAHTKLRHIPIAFLTGSVPRDELGRSSTALHGFPILSKPVSIEEIDRCVKACIETKGPRR